MKTASNINAVSLHKLLFAEKKDMAMNILNMIDAGFLPTPDRSTTVKLSDVDRTALEEALQMVEANTKEYGGSFAKAYINFDGASQVECVIKLSKKYQDSDMSWKYLKLCKKLGGRSYSAALPDVYYLNTDIKLVNETVTMCVLEYVDTITKVGLSNLDNVRRGVDSIGAINGGVMRRVYGEMIKQQDLELLHWTEQDFDRFVEVLTEVTQARHPVDLRAALDISRDNIGIRPSDGSVCVFDPVYG